MNAVLKASLISNDVDKYFLNCILDVKAFRYLYYHEASLASINEDNDKLNKKHQVDKENEV